MSSLIRVILKTVLTLFAGIGTGAVLDKVAADKLPNYTSPTADLTPGTSGFNPMKLVYMVLAFAAGAVILRFIGKKTRISILK
jgi:TRAP-type C4-dicarboxylate transport system permease small subunit